MLQYLIKRCTIAGQIATQGFTDIRLRAVTDQPLFYLALLAVVLGVMLFLTDFIAEMISRNSSQRNTYKIREQF